VCSQHRESLIEGLVGKLKELTGYEPDRQRLAEFVDERSESTGKPQPITADVPISAGEETDETVPADEAYWVRQALSTLETAKAFLAIVKPLDGDADLKFVKT
jgi:hypothetical protein